MFSSPLHILVLISALYAILALAYLVVRTFAWGRPTLYAPSTGKSSQGIWYAFGQGMMPWEKESAGKHLPTFIAGIFYHLAVLAAIICLILGLTNSIVSSSYSTILRTILSIGILSGLGLFIKRLSKPHMRGISTPDDYIANLLVTIFIASALMASFNSRFANLLFVCAIVLFFYMPIGKIRHCVFFFYTRILFGAFFGRRNVYPHQASEADRG
jgi:nitrate reductase gamma subunit